MAFSEWPNPAPLKESQKKYFSISCLSLALNFRRFIYLGKWLAVPLALAWPLFYGRSAASSRAALWSSACRWHSASSIDLWIEGGLWIQVKRPVGAECTVLLPGEAQGPSVAWQS